MKNNFFATCPKGLEGVLLEEMQSFGAENIKSTVGGVFFSGNLKTCYRANLESRIATRILQEIKSGFYKTENDLYHLAKSVEWEYFFQVHKTFKISTQAIRCPLKSLNFVTLKIKDAVCDRFRQKTGERPNVQNLEPNVRIAVFLTHNRATLYLDSSGAPLFARGLRKKSVLAPIKENLAAGILKLLNWQENQALFDPLCGSGTFLLEALLMAHNIAPGKNRNFSFENWRIFDENLWQNLKKIAIENEKQPQNLNIFGSDMDEKALFATKMNLKNAGFSIPLKQQNILDAQASVENGLMLGNPPYGERLNEWDENFHAQLAQTLKKHWSTWQCAFLSADLDFPHKLRLKPKRKIPLFNGALDCRLFLFPMVKGSNR